MSVDIKVIADAIKKAGDNSEELEKVIKQYDVEIKTLSDNAEVGASVKEKGIFKQLKEAQDKLAEIERKQKEDEDKRKKEQGEYKDLADKYKLERDEFETKFKTTSDIADKWTTYEKARREMLLGKIKDDKKKKIAEQLTTLETLEQFVELETGETFGGGSSNHRQDPPKDKKPIIEYKTMK